MPRIVRIVPVVLLVERLRGTLHGTAIAGGHASLLTRRRALKAGS